MYVGMGFHLLEPVNMSAKFSMTTHDRNMKLEINIFSGMHYDPSIPQFHFLQEKKSAKHYCM